MLSNVAARPLARPETVNASASESRAACLPYMEQDRARPALLRGETLPLATGREAASRSIRTPKTRQQCPFSMSATGAESVPAEFVCLPPYKSISRDSMGTMLLPNLLGWAETLLGRC